MNTQSLEHTPGPWELDDGEIYGKLKNDFYGTGMIVRIPVEYRPNELATSEDKANANLIAAAPELLEALLEAVRQLEGAPYWIEQVMGGGSPAITGTLATCAKARAAIAKAEGRGQQ